MKKIFPIITILIGLSLLGLIFFQFLWLKTALDIRKEQLNQSINKVAGEAGLRLMEENNFIPKQKRNDILFPTDKLHFEFKKSSVIGRYSLAEIRDILQSAFNAQGLKNVPFEFAVTENSLNSDQIESENFFKYYLDSAKNERKFVPLVGASGSSLENLTNEEFLVIIVPNQRSLVLQNIMWFIIGTVIFTIVIITAFFITIKTLLKQKKLSEIKSDFINNMTHEFKTPLATISLAVDALKNEKVVADKEKSNYFTGIIKEENRRMNKQVETILQAALLDKQEVQLNLKKVSAHQLINNAINNITLPVQEKGGELIVNLAATQDLIMADDVHFTNLVNNLLDNALKYSKENPVIHLTTSNTAHHFKIKIEDNGIGMSKDTLSRIFEKFYRAHTGNVHNVKGFGLGLSYVKKMVKAQKGTIKAESTPGKGSCFFIDMPLAKA